MNRLAREKRAFATFERRLLDLVRSYWLDHDSRHLDAAARLLRRLQSSVPDWTEVSDRQLLVVTGWVARRFGYRLSARALRRLNPGYRVRVHRSFRKDVVLSWRHYSFRAGFFVVAKAPIDSKPFAFGLINRDGDYVEMQPSNPDAGFKLSHLGALPLASAGAAMARRTPAPVGYVDDVIFSMVIGDSSRRAWLGALAHLHPEEMFEIVDSAQGRFSAPAIARLLEYFPANARWSDRFALSAFGDEATFTSDRTPLAVIRPYGETPWRGTSSMTIPSLKRHGNIVEAVPSHTAMPSPSTEWLRYEDGVIQDGGTLVVDGRLVVYEEGADPRLDFVSGQWESVFGSRAQPSKVLVQLRPIAEKAILEGILLSGRNDFNWYHWLIEYLPRVLQVEDSLDDGVPVIVSSRTPATGIAALHSLTNRPIVVVDSAFAYRVGILHVVAPPVKVLDTTRVAWPQGVCMNSGPLLAMREAWGLNRLENPPMRRVFLSRNSGHRGLHNEKAIAAIATRHGLETIDPGGLSWQEQKDLFSSAALLAGASGAVMANYLMMAPGSRILALTSKPLSNFVLPAALAGVAGAHFSYLTGPSKASLKDAGHRRNWIHSDFTIGVAAFEAALVHELRALDRRPTSGGHSGEAIDQ